MRLNDFFFFLISIKKANDFITACQCRGKTKQNETKTKTNKQNDEIFL